MEKFIQMDEGSGQTVITANGFVYAPKGGRANFLPASKGQFFALWRATLIPVPESKFFPYPRTNFLPVPQDKPFFFGKGELSFHPHGQKISIHHAPPPQSGAKHLHRGGGHLDVGGGELGGSKKGKCFCCSGETEHRILLHSPPLFWCLRKNPPTRKIELAPPSPSILKKMGQKRREGG